MQPKPSNKTPTIPEKRTRLAGITHAGHGIRLVLVQLGKHGVGLDPEIDGALERALLSKRLNEKANPIGGQALP